MKPIKAGDKNTGDAAWPRFCVVIPARLESSRLPRKPMAEINGRPMIEHIYRHATQSAASVVVVATDSDEIASHIDSIGGAVCLTSSSPTCGTERVAEAAEKLGWEDDTIVVNAQCDEPGLDAHDFDRVAERLARFPEDDMATLAMPMVASECHEQSRVKVVTDAEGRGLYFSRACIPCNARDGEYLHHIGIYGYRVSTLKRFLCLPACMPEQRECLEQLRALYHGMRIHVGVIETKAVLGVDTETDLAHARKVMQA